MSIWSNKIKRWLLSLVEPCAWLLFTHGNGCDEGSGSGSSREDHDEDAMGGRMRKGVEIRKECWKRYWVHKWGSFLLGKINEWGSWAAAAGCKRDIRQSRMAQLTVHSVANLLYWTMVRYKVVPFVGHGRKMIFGGKCYMKWNTTWEQEFCHKQTVWIMTASGHTILHPNCWPTLVAGRRQGSDLTLLLEHQYNLISNSRPLSSIGRQLY